MTHLNVLDGRRGGATFDELLDMQRLNKQQRAVYEAVRSGQWMTLREIAHVTGFPEASISARLRDFRKKKFGGHIVERRRRTAGTWEYRLQWNGGGA